MSDRRPTQRPTNSSAKRPAQPGRRETRRPDPANNHHKNKKRASGRFYAFLAILIVIVLAIVLILWKPWAKPDNVSPDVPVNSQVDNTVLPAGNDGGTDVDTTVPNDPSALAAHLNSENEVTGLTTDQMVTVEDLSINPNLSADWKNILLLGTAQRDASQSTRSDTMIICSVNTQTGEVKLENSVPVE